MLFQNTLQDYMDGLTMIILRNSDWKNHLILFFISAVLGLFAIFNYGQKFVNSDIIVQSLMSRYNLTLFYWNQDRFISFVPFLTSFVTEPEANLWLLMFVYSMSFYAFIVYSAWFCGKLIGINHSNTQWLLVGFILIVPVYFMGPGMHFVFTIEGQPYGISFILALISIILAFSEKKYNFIISFVFMIIALGLNPSLLIIYVVTSAFLIVSKRYRMALFIIIISCSIFCMWTMIGLYSKFSNTNLYKNIYFPLNYDIKNVIYNINNNQHYIFGYIFIITFPAILILLFSKYKILLVYLLSIIILWIAIFSSNQWIKLNGQHFRYFFPVIISLYGLVAIVLFALSARFLPIRFQGYCAGLLIVSSLMLSFAPPVRLKEAPLWRSLDQQVEFAIANDIRYIGGTYWLSWPVVFEIGRRGQQAHGLGLRAAANRKGLREVLKKGDLAICIGHPVTECLSDARIATGLEWGPADGSCGVNCTLFRLVSDPRFAGMAELQLVAWGSRWPGDD